MPGTLKNSKDYTGPLVGLEIEAYASCHVTGVDDGEDEASPRSIRRVARRLRETTGLPFRAIANANDTTSGSTERVPTSSPLNPIWAVRSDWSLDPCAAPNDEYAVGVEVITPPLEPSLAAGGDFLPGFEAGVHVNVSVPGLLATDAPGLALLDPFRREASNSRLEGFGDPLFDTVI